ncbi:MAG TPA: RNA polymerase sigma factor [Propionibacteriaceae bacterium]|nr:RNA polymerase sigma factor [Propionibacteriaceae bacterium]
MRLPDVPLPPFEDVVRRYGPTVLRVCRAVLGWDRAEDAWSETFLAALQAYPELPPGSNVEAWLVTIAKRKAIDQHRAAARHPVPLAELPQPGVDDRHFGDGDTQIREALDRLPFKQREAVAYHYLGGLSYAEVSTLLGNSTDAARRAAADGMKTLRSLYRKEAP